MEATEHAFITPRTARYFQLGNFESPKRIWFVLHGYGQLAQYFIRNFSAAVDEGDLIIAPEGLSRFYLDGTFGRVGASWMTKEDRLNEIGDYLAYLESLAQSILSPFGHQSPEIILFGFSQGCATAVRWAKHSSLPFGHLVLWAGDLPPESAIVMDQLAEDRIWMAYGDQDEYFTQSVFESRMAKIHEKHPGVRPFPFRGNHSIPSAAFQQFLQQLSRL